MDIQTTRIELAKLVLSESREAVLRKVGELLKTNEVDWWEEISNEEREAIEEGIAEADRGELVPHEEVRNQLKSKFGI